MQHRLVLRRFVDPDWLAREPDLAHREAHVLRLLASTDVPAPAVVAVDTDAAACDVPAVLMTRLSGSVTFAPGDMTSRITGIAAALPSIHAVDGRAHSEVPPYQSYNNPSELQPPAWSNRADAWRRALEVLSSPAPATQACFIHRDYHPGNVLWSDGRLTGVIDWVNASWGPPEIDLGHCRLNLVLLYGCEIAERFLTIYQSITDDKTYHPYWDLLTATDSLPRAGVYQGWIDAGLTHLTDELCHSRIDEHVAAAVARL